MSAEPPQHYRGAVPSRPPLAIPARAAIVIGAIAGGAAVGGTAGAVAFGDGGVVPLIAAGIVLLCGLIGGGIAATKSAARYITLGIGVLAAVVGIIVHLLTGQIEVNLVLELGLSAVLFMVGAALLPR